MRYDSKTPPPNFEIRCSSKLVAVGFPKWHETRIFRAMYPTATRFYLLPPTSEKSHICSNKSTSSAPTSEKSSICRSNICRPDHKPGLIFEINLQLFRNVFINLTSNQYRRRATPTAIHLTYFHFNHEKTTITPLTMLRPVAFIYPADRLQKRASKFNHGSRTNFR